ncbi:MULTISPECIES: ATP-dependent RecD-like DNA helicase [Metabacillus]|uniref:ATP-dependent RecD2 DNA helicase n=1 Tax=Metabacillus rhizolycopersici TaxID=2875709 RepID=A0ABS7UM01_9BACI|nr:MULTISPECIES: ATP-dependent RecD-like DNA helicase [Metabacillus]MBZ5749345.1 ATP-dependent RecD-like DNA helicase [Metabacillus rhizolycopersici]MCM3650570.1 ATP-dependent RecD-like DNA helicase [Metabacillus litoralis]
MQESADLFGENERYVKGLVKVVIFHNEQNLYSVLKVRVHETSENIEDKEITVTGYFPLLHEDDTYTFYGTLTNHPKFGLQFQTERFRKEIPQTKEGIIQYLSSDLFKGIGKKTAEVIVEKLGESAISKILQNPAILDDIPKLNKDKAKQLVEALVSHQGLEQIMIALNQFGFGPQLAMKIYQSYQDQTLKVIQENPYQLVHDVEGIGFVRADQLGQQLGISGKSSERIKAACLYNIEQLSLQEGHVYLTQEQLIVKTRELLNHSTQELIHETDIAAVIITLGTEKQIIIEEERAYLPSLYYAEQGLVKKINKVLEQTEYNDLFPESEFLLSLGNLEERMSVQYAPTQKDAIQKALMSPMLLLTGGPGTGKTTVIKGIVELYADLHGCSLDPKDYKKEEPFPILLVAPTGRAAKRMSEATGMPAVTIHRLLKWNGADGFEHDEDNPIAGKLLIVDEGSMVDIWIAHQLFKALPDQIQVIMVGDEDQLPSVGPGQVLRDLLASNKIPTVRLMDIYRQAEGSSIIELAHEIKQGKLPQNITVPTSDRSFIQCSQSQMKEVIEKVIKSAINKGYTAKDIQVLAPMYRGPAGIDQLNKLLQELFNPKTPGKREMKFGEVIYRNGDKILQLVNQPESNVYNGDIGEIVSIFYAKENTEKEDMIIVSFEGIEVTYTKQDFNQFTHAFCCSIHKSQGSEFPIVVLPIVKGYFRMLRRNLIYTAITRSKRSLVLCGEKDALQMGISNSDSSDRQTSLMLKLSGSVEIDELQKELPFPVQDANIGMENVTPYDFMVES